MGKDEYAYVIEYLPHGLMDSKDHKASAIILTDSLSLLLVATKKDVSLEAGKKVYIGEKKRDEIHHIMSRISPDKLNGSGKDRLVELIAKKVKEEEARFTAIINILGPVNVRLNSLELIPNIGKKLMQKIIEERKKQPFINYEDINKRLQLASSIEKDIAERIMGELEGKDKYRIFT